MAIMRLKGLNWTSKRLADGRVVKYYYAWKGGPRLEGEPGSPEFIASFAKAAAQRKAVGADTLAGLVKRYRAAPEFTRLATSTRREFNRWLDRIASADIGALPLAALIDHAVRVDLLAWRDRYADHPRQADYGLDVLRRVLGWSKDRGLISENHMTGGGRLYRNDRADQVWSPEEIDAVCAHMTPAGARGLRLACLTGLRRADLVALDWRDVGLEAIVIRTQKSRKTTSATIPLLPGAHAIIAEIGRKLSGPVLLNSHGKPWSPMGFGNAVIDARAKAGVTKHLHDCRGTFATLLRQKGLTRDEIASVMGWRAERVEAILARYVDQDAFVRHIAAKLNRPDE